MIRTDEKSDVLNEEEVVPGYRNQKKVKLYNQNIKAVMLELRPMYHKIDERLKISLKFIFCRVSTV